VCENQLSTAEIITLKVFAASAIIVPVLLPILSGQITKRFCRMKIKGDANVFLDAEVEIHWGQTGIFVLLFILSFGFCGIFFNNIIRHGLVSPCNGPVGGCPTISCVAGTYAVEVYVFMQITLTLIPVLVVRQASEIVANHASPTFFLKVCKYIFYISMLSTTLTGIYPARYRTDVTRVDFQAKDSMLDKYGWVHTIGITIGAVLPVVTTLGAFIRSFVKAHKTGNQFISPLCLVTRCFFFVIYITSFVVFLANNPTPDTLDYCSHFRTESECNAFLQINGSDCTLDELEKERIRFDCAWTSWEGSGFTKAVLSTTIASYPSEWEGSCKRNRCELYKNAFSICAEFAALFISVCYITSFGLFDLKYFVNPPEFVRYETEDPSLLSQQDEGEL